MFKINTATIVFLALMFRLFVVNIYAVSSLKTIQANNLLTFHFSTILKRRQTTNTVANSNLTKFHHTEVCAENSDQQVTLKRLKLIIIKSFFYSIIKISSKSYNSFDSIKCKIYPKRYLAFSLFRI
jgi:hypothetical protein